MTDDEIMSLPMMAPVIKSKGDYHWSGLLLCRFRTPDGHLRVVVAHPVEKGHVLHIYSPAQLEPTP